MSDDLSDELRAFEGSDALGNGDFSVCVRGAAEITRLRAALATARQEGMEEAAQIAAAFEGVTHLHGPWSDVGHECAAQAAGIVAAAIRAAAGEGK